MSINIIYKFVMLLVPFIYLRYDKRVAFFLLALFLAYPLIFRLAPSFRKKAAALKFSSLKLNEEKAQELIYYLAAIFIVINSFEKNIAVFSSLIALAYIFIVSVVSIFSKVRFFGKSFGALFVGLIIIYYFGLYFGSYISLDRNLILASVIALFVVDLLLRWPNSDFNIIFFTAVVAQFVKNSF